MSVVPALDHLELLVALLDADIVHDARAEERDREAVGLVLVQLVVALLQERFVRLRRSRTSHGCRAS